MKRLIFLILPFLLLSSSSALTQHEGFVIETMNSGGYTYAQIQDGDSLYWIASPETWVQNGVQVTYYEQMWMPSFKSSTLNKTFDKIMFVSGLTIVKEEGKDSITTDISERSGMENAIKVTIADLLEKKGSMEGNWVVVSGEVTKVSDAILGNNWIHLVQKNDKGDSFTLIATSPEHSAKVGDVIDVVGKVALNKDFGYGYKYDILIESAVVNP